jgi:hypothetical protein
MIMKGLYILWLHLYQDDMAGVDSLPSKSLIADSLGNLGSS